MPPVVLASAFVTSPCSNIAAAEPAPQSSSREQQAGGGGKIKAITLSIINPMEEYLENLESSENLQNTR